MSRLSTRLDRLERLAEAQQTARADAWDHLGEQQLRALVVLWRDGWWPYWPDNSRAAGDPRGFEAACLDALEEAATLQYLDASDSAEENHRRYERWQAIFRPFMAWLHAQVTAA